MWRLIIIWKKNSILLCKIWCYNLYTKAFVQMTVLRGSRPSRLSIYIEIQYLYSVRARYSIRFCHRQICCELKFPPFRDTICNIPDWIPAPFGKLCWLFSTICDLPSQKRICTLVKCVLHLHHQINTFSASLFTRMRAHDIIAFITI